MTIEIGEWARYAGPRGRKESKDKGQDREMGPEKNDSEEDHGIIGQGLKKQSALWLASNKRLLRLSTLIFPPFCKQFSWTLVLPAAKANPVSAPPRRFHTRWGRGCELFASRNNCHDPCPNVLRQEKATTVCEDIFKRQVVNPSLNPSFYRVRGRPCRLEMMSHALVAFSRGGYGEYSGAPPPARR